MTMIVERGNIPPGTANAGKPYYRRLLLESLAAQVVRRAVGAGAESVVLKFPKTGSRSDLIVVGEYRSAT